LGLFLRMSDKTLIYLGATVGSLIGGYVPSFFGVDSLSFVSILTGAAGGILGIVIMYRYIHS
jgi:predicted MFS family arabinose efflux permease